MIKKNPDWATCINIGYETTKNKEKTDLKRHENSMKRHRAQEARDADLLRVINDSNGTLFDDKTAGNNKSARTDLTMKDLGIIYQKLCSNSRMIRKLQEKVASLNIERNLIKR